MRKFISKIVLILLPVCVIFSFYIPFYIAGVITGEFTPILTNIQKQRSNSEIILGLGYNEQTPYYKLTNANYYKSKVITVGPSRVMQFKGSFFKESFYNGGGAVNGNFDEYLCFLQSLTYVPEVALFSLDMWAFNEEWMTSYTRHSNFTGIHEFNRDLKTMLNIMIKDWFSGKWKFDNLNLYPNNIGFNGCIKDAGFLGDGSHYYGYIYRHPEEQKDYQFADTLHRIATGTSRFEWGEHIYEETLLQLEKFLRYCNEKGIIAIGIMTPFAPTVYIAMLNSGNYGYLHKITPTCEKIFAKYDCEFFDYHDAKKLGVTDEFFVDGFHGSEVVYGYMLNDMADKGSIIKNYIDRDRIDNMLRTSYNGHIMA